jgi:hypothetical protein
MASWNLPFTLNHSVRIPTATSLRLYASEVEELHYQPELDVYIGERFREAIQ